MTKEDKKFPNVMQELQMFFDTEQQICNEAINAPHTNHITTQRIKERMKIVSEALVSTNTAVANQKESYKTEKDTINITPARNANDKLSDNPSLTSNQQPTIKNMISYASDLSITDNLKQLMDSAKKLTNASTEQRYTLLQYIMDRMVLMFTAAVTKIPESIPKIEASLKVLESIALNIGGYHADIIKAGHEAKLIRPRLKKHQESLTKAVSALETYQTQSQANLIGQLDEISKILGITTETHQSKKEFIDAVETSVHKHLQKNDIPTEQLGKLYEDTVTNINNYNHYRNNVSNVIKSLKNDLEGVKKAIATLDKHVGPKAPAVHKAQIDAKRKTHLEKVREQNEQRSKFHTK